MTAERFARMQAAIARAWAVSPFHRRHWRAAGVPEGWIPPSPEALGRLPVVTKEALLEGQRREAPWGGNLCVPEAAIAQIHLTSGTSGIGQERYALTAADVAVMGGSWRPQYEAIGLVPGDVAIFTIPVSLFCAGLSALEGARRHGLVPIFTGVSAKDLILRMIGEHRAAYLYGTESFLLQLAGVAREMGMAGAWRGHLKGVQSVGASPQLLAACEEVFGAPLFEVYGCTQAAAKIATTCALGAGRGTTHFHDEHLFIELRHPETGDLVTEGPADIIVSTPYREASPVFRFDIRDRVDVVPAGSCACGDPRPGFRPGTLRRSDGMLKIRGVNVWPEAVERLLLAHPEVRDFRATVRRRQDGADELEIRVAPRRGEAIAPALLGALAEEVRAATMVRPHLLVDGAIADIAGAYKIRRWSDERPRFAGASEGGGDGAR